MVMNSSSHSLPDISARWGDHVTSEVLRLGDDLNSLETDTSVQMKSAATFLKGLGDQVSRLEQYVDTAPVTRIDYAQSSGWIVNSPTMSPKVTLSIPLPGFNGRAEVYATGHGYILDNANPQVYSGDSRIVVNGNASTNVAGAPVGTIGNVHWGHGGTQVVSIPISGSGSISVTYEFNNTVTFSPAVTQASLLAITTFYRS